MGGATTMVETSTRALWTTTKVQMMRTTPRVNGQPAFSGAIAATTLEVLLFLHLRERPASAKAFRRLEDARHASLGADSQCFQGVCLVLELTMRAVVRLGSSQRCMQARPASAKRLRCTIAVAGRHGQHQQS